MNEFMNEEKGQEEEEREDDDDDDDDFYMNIIDIKREPGQVCSLNLLSNIICFVCVRLRSMRVCNKENNNNLFNWPESVLCNKLSISF